MANIFPINSFIAEHWLYMASIGWFFIVATLIYNAYEKSREAPLLKYMLLFLTAFLTFSYSLLTVERNRDWKDEITFFKSTIAHSPNNTRLYLNLGNTYHEKGMPHKAIEQYEKVISIRGDNAGAYGNMGAVYLSEGNLGKGEEYLKKAIATNYNHPVSHYNLAIIYYRWGRKKEAIKELETALKQMPQLYSAYNLLGKIYLEEKNPGKAHDAFQKSLSTMPAQPRIKELLKNSR